MSFLNINMIIVAILVLCYFDTFLYEMSNQMAVEVVSPLCTFEKFYRVYQDIIESPESSNSS